MVTTGNSYIAANDSFLKLRRNSALWYENEMLRGKKKKKRDVIKNKKDSWWHKAEAGHAVRWTKGVLVCYHLFLAEWFLMMSDPRTATTLACVKSTGKTPREKPVPSPHYTSNSSVLLDRAKALGWGGWPRRVWLRSLCCSPLEQLLVGFQAAPNPLLSSSSLKLCAPSPEPPQQAFAGSISLSWHSLWRGTMSPMPTQPAKPRQSQAEGHPPWLAGRSHVAPSPYRHTGLLCKSRSLPLLRGDPWTIFRFCTMLLGGSSSLWHTINKSTQFSSLRLCRQNWSHLELLVFLFLLRNVSVLQRQ